MRIREIKVDTTSHLFTTQTMLIFIFIYLKKKEKNGTCSMYVTTNNRCYVTSVTVKIFSTSYFSVCTVHNTQFYFTFNCHTKSTTIQDILSVTCIKNILASVCFSRESVCSVDAECVRVCINIYCTEQ